MTGVDGNGRADDAAPMVRVVGAATSAGAQRVA
jgi:hypothetical protein